MSTGCLRGMSRRAWVASGLAVAGGLAALAYGTASYVVYDALSHAPRACWPRDAANTPASFVVPRRCRRRPRRRPTACPATRTSGSRSRDPAMARGRLAGWWIPSEDPGAPAVVLIHGIKSCRREANVLIPAAMLHRAGLSVLLMDLRDHGDSDGDDGRFAGGSEEYLDVLGGWDWVRSQGVPAERIGLLGVSFGAVTAIIAGGQEPGVAACGQTRRRRGRPRRSGCSSRASSATPPACRSCSSRGAPLGPDHGGRRPHQVRPDR